LTPARIVADLAARVGSVAVIEAIQTLRRRSLLGRRRPGLSRTLSLHQVVLDYFTSQHHDLVAAQSTTPGLRSAARRLRPSRP
jgi:hypothetical protein